VASLIDYDLRKKNLIDPTGGLIDADVEAGLLTAGPTSLAQVNKYTAPFDVGTWKIPQLTAKSNIAQNPRVTTNYRNVRFGGDVLARLDLQADLDKTLRDRGVKADKWGTRSVQNAQPYDHSKTPNKALSSERVLVGRVTPLKAGSDGTINFDKSVNQSDRTRVYNKVVENISNGKSPYHKLSKAARHGPIGQIDKTMTRTQIDFIRKNGVEIRFNPVTQNVMTTTDGRVIKNVPNGRAVTYGNRVYVVDQNWGTRGIQYYNSLSEMPKEMRDNVKSGPLQKKLKFGRSGGLGDARTSLGGSPSRFTGLMQYIPRGGR
jgi:hypothetical protein